MNAGWNNKLCCLYNVRMYTLDILFSNYFSLLHSHYYKMQISSMANWNLWHGYYMWYCDSAAWLYYIIILPIIYKRSETLVRVYNLNVTFTWIEFEISEKSDQLKFMLEKTLYLGACKYFKSSSVNAVILIMILHEIHVF